MLTSVLRLPAVDLCRRTCALPRARPNVYPPSRRTVPKGYLQTSVEKPQGTTGRRPRHEEPPRSRCIRLEHECQRRARLRAASDGEPEVDDVAVLHDVLLALEAELARFAALRLAAVAHEVVEGDHL